MLISEISFVSELYEDKPFSTEASTSLLASSSPGLLVTGTTEADLVIPPVSTGTTQSSVQTVHEQAESQYVGLVIGILLTIITLLIAGTFCVILRIRRGKYTPTHSLVGARIQDRISAGIHFQDLTTPYKAKMRVYGQVSAKEDECNMSPANPVTHSTYSTGFPSSDPVLSDCTDDYAEP